MDKVIVVAGVTAAGKSRLAVDLALRLGGEIISADAYQVYRGMDVGTNKTPIAARRGVPHHLIDCVSVDEPWDVSLFQKHARRLVAEITARQRIPIVCGGTGFYINALLRDYRFLPLAPKGDHAALTNLQLHEALLREDAAEARRVPANNRRRVEKALDFVRGHGLMKSVHDQGRSTLLYDALVFFLDPPRAEIAEAIGRRTAEMLHSGWQQEVAALAAAHPAFAQSTAVKAIGYEDVLAGHADPAKIAAKVLAYTRRQRTWFANKPDPRVVVLREGYSEHLLQKCLPQASSFLGGAPCA